MSNFITVNLAPAEELENPYWYVPDLVTLLVVAMISYFIINSSLQQLRDEIEVANIEAEELTRQSVTLKSKTKRFDELNKFKENLIQKRDAVERITSSKLDRYIPIIILENIQNLKPDGIWLSSIAFMQTENGTVSSNNKTTDLSLDKPEDYNLVTIEGSGFDNMLIAEFIMNLKSTLNQTSDKSDLRSLVYFDEMMIHNTVDETNTLQLEPTRDSQSSKEIIENYMVDSKRFKISFRFKEKESEQKEVDLKISKILSNMKSKRHL